MLIIGTSALVAPASKIPLDAQNNGATLIEINPTVSRITSNVDVHLPLTASDELAQILKVLDTCAITTINIFLRSGTLSGAIIYKNGSYAYTGAKLMARVVILGSAAAVNDANHDYTHFILIGENDTPILVDAGSNPLGKIKNLGIDDESLQDVILTHFHPDHVAGIPNMMMHMWLLGRKAPMRIYGLHHCINRIEDIMEAYGWQEWPNFFPVSFHRISHRDDAPLLENNDFRIRAFPVKHFVPTIGMRVENKHNGKILGYGCDTEPCPGVRKIAQDVDVLIHEAAGDPPGHSTATHAGQIAAECNAKSLYLIHYQVWNQDPAPLVAEAEQVYDGPVHLCKDFDEFEF